MGTPFLSRSRLPSYSKVDSLCSLRLQHVLPPSIFKIVSVLSDFLLVMVQMMWGEILGAQTASPSLYES